MAKIDITDTITYPIEDVYPLFRDKLATLQEHLPSIRSIEVVSRERVDENTVKVVNIWKGSADEIPKIAQAFVKPEMLQWTDRATWHDESYSCDWDMEVGFLTDAISSSGTTTYTASEDGKTTRVHIVGELKIDAKKIPGVPKLLSGKVGNAIEAFVVKMITPNLKESNRGAERALSSSEC